MEGQLKGFMSYSMLPLCIHNCGRSFHYDLQAQEILLPFLVQFFVYFLGLADHPSARKHHTGPLPPLIGGSGLLSLIGDFSQRQLLLLLGKVTMLLGDGFVFRSPVKPAPKIE